MGWDVFFSDWASLGRIVLVGASTYAGLVVVLRISGKRTLAKMNAFDFVVTIAFGSILAATMLDDSIPWAAGMTALVVLVLMQYLLSQMSVRWSRFRELVASEPALLVHEGRLLKQAMRRERITEEEVMHALRGAGLAGPENARAVVLEADGRFSVVTTGNVSMTNGFKPGLE